jgi:pimeloyl-ACP methyl ester carboxylesterase
MTRQLFWNCAGTGEPLLLLHGIGSTHDDFAALRPRLDAEYRVLAPDLPGHGRSAALPHRPTVAAIADAVTADLDELGIDRVHVLGNSIGARIALELAARGRARSVVAISPSGLNTPGERLHQGALMAASRLALREGFVEADAYWQMLWWSILADVPTGLDRIDCPVVLAQGTADLIAVGQTPRYLTVIPGARFVPLYGAGHAPQSDTPGVILRLVHESTAAAIQRAVERPRTPTALRPSA